MFCLCLTFLCLFFFCSILMNFSANQMKSTPINHICLYCVVPAGGEYASYAYSAAQYPYSTTDPSWPVRYPSEYMMYTQHRYTCIPDPCKMQPLQIHLCLHITTIHKPCMHFQQTTRIKTSIYEFIIL